MPSFLFAVGLRGDRRRAFKTSIELQRSGAVRAVTAAIPPTQPIASKTPAGVDSRTVLVMIGALVSLFRRPILW